MSLSWIRISFVATAAFFVAGAAFCHAAGEADGNRPVQVEVPVRVPEITPAIPPAAASGSMAQPSFNYRIKPKDTVQVRVFDEGDMDTTSRVDKDGNIAYPLLGTAKIGGLTVQEATETMETLLRKYLVHPQVSVAILAFTKEHFTILGQVTKPGTYDLPDEEQMDLLEAIGLAGGYTKIANPGNILVKRLQDGKEMLIKFNGKNLLIQRHAGEPIPQILPNDTIMVGESVF